LADNKTDAGSPIPDPGSPPAEDPRVADLQAKLDEALAASKRWQAEFVNYQQRVARDREGDRKYAVEALLRDFLPAVDTVQTAIRQMTKSGAAAAAVEAVRLVERELLRILGKQGVKAIDPQAQFDPNLHDALGVVETAEQPEGAIVEVLQPGYLLHERVLRPATVRVAKGRTRNPEPGTRNPEP